MVKRYCSYCGRIAHRCRCGEDDSKLHQFFARSSSVSTAYYPLWMPTPYKRGVPPQVKRKIRYRLRKNYSVWYDALSEIYGEHCANCGVSIETHKLVLDHVISVAKGGQSELANLQLLCEPCNLVKGKLCIDCRSDTI